MSLDLTDDWVLCSSNCGSYEGYFPISKIPSNFFEKESTYSNWLYKPVPYCCRECVPKELQHKDQLYELEINGKVSSTFKGRYINYIGGNHGVEA